MSAVADVSRIAVVGCGNPARRDDGAGPAVIARLQQCLEPRANVQLLDAGTDGMAVMFSARGCDRLIIVDAARTGVEAGAIYEVPGAELERPYQPGFNLHDFRWDSALHAGRRIFGEAFPADVTVLLIEAQSVDFGVGLSPAVEAGVEMVAQRVRELIADDPESVEIARGGLYLAHALYTRWFDGLESVVLLRSGEALQIVPVRHAAAGGYLLKQRNARGDRVIHAPDFFREHGLAEDPGRMLPGHWDETAAAFVVPRAFANKVCTSQSK